RRRGREGGETREPEIYEPRPLGDPELDRAVADFDRPPVGEPERIEASIEPEPLEAERAEPPPEPPRPEAPVEPTQQPRRRSPVRAPAPFCGSRESEQTPPTAAAETKPAEPEHTAAPMPEPSVETEGADRPRRTGWWARRLAGKN